MNLFKPDVKKMADKKDIPGLIKAAEWGLRHRNIKVCLEAITALGDIKDSRAVTPLLQMVEEADLFFSEQSHPITAAIFIVIGKIGALSSLPSLTRLFCRLQLRPSTFIPIQPNDERYAAFIFATQAINHNEDRNLVNVIFQNILQPEELISKKEMHETDSIETWQAALEALSVIGEEEDIIRLEKIVTATLDENRNTDLSNAIKVTIGKIKKRVDNDKCLP